MRKTRANKKRVNKTKKRKMRGGNGELCSICQEELSIRDLLFTHETCKNIFHKKCITTWCKKLDEDNRDCSCPMCREIMHPVDYNLEQEYNNLVDENIELQIDYEETLDDYNKLVGKYNVLHNNYNELAGKYNVLHNKHNEFVRKFNTLKTILSSAQDIFAE
jgi:hypothetical protein